MLEQVEVVATNPQEKARYSLQIEELKQKQRAVMEDPDAHGKLRWRRKYWTPKGAVVTDDIASTFAGQESGASVLATTTQPTNLDNIRPHIENLSALAAAADSLASVSGSSKGNGAVVVSPPLGVQIPAAALASPAPLTTPMHAGTSSHASSPSGRLSPSNRKMLLVKTAADVENRLRSTSMGSFQD
ncbi:unnamed protein product [Phytophthora fragariaefolia]|uniref:Unnamed protein product n=1 Tax=Phytophthora fragariaefolia TaxID=1490495 RepID=A0A9W7CR28_9STRA|nr:unnamed protein product [Phytophthora fragariaefolia]